LPAGPTKYSVVVAVSDVGSSGAGGSPGMWAVTGLQVASVQPGPTCAHGTSASAASTPCAATGAAVMDVDVDASGLPDGGCPEFEAGVDEHAAIDAEATAMTANLRHAGMRPEDECRSGSRFIVISFPMHAV
jgi:hypothetical protein